VLQLLGTASLELAAISPATGAISKSRVAKQGDRSQAAKAYREFLEAWSHADRDLPQIQAAQEFLSGQ